MEAANTQAHVIFVHGLDGDPFKTWRLDEPDSWGSWFAHSVPEVSIWSLKYRIRSSDWHGGAMPLTQRAINVLATLKSTLNDEAPIVFICPSYGGLLVKQLLRSGHELVRKYSDIAERVAGIIFFATPHTGSSIPNYLNALEAVLSVSGIMSPLKLFFRKSTAVAELRKNQPALSDLNMWFRNKLDEIIGQLMFISKRKGQTGLG